MLLSFCVIFAIDHIVDEGGETTKQLRLCLSRPSGDGLVTGLSNIEIPDSMLSLERRRSAEMRKAKRCAKQAKQRPLRRLCAARLEICGCSNCCVPTTQLPNPDPLTQKQIQEACVLHPHHQH